MLIEDYYMEWHSRLMDSVIERFHMYTEDIQPLNFYGELYGREEDDRHTRETNR